jgi:tetratricopeptide (TPR) repeat protein
MIKYLLVAAIALSSSQAVAADSLSAARDLYASASYEEALAMLGRLNAAELPPAEGRAADQYRALCLLALGKTSEASQAIEAVVAAEPLYHPSDSEVSPRVRAVFSDVRKRLLPGLVQQKYALAKTAYDHKDYRVASAGFGQLLALYDDPDLAPAVGKPPLSDLRVLIDGFHSLSVQALAPPPAPEPPPAAATAPRPAVAAVPDVARIYASGDANVVPPVSIRQELPPFAGVVPQRLVGAMEVVIDETGKVVSAAMRAPTLPNYDRQAVNAAQSWRYRPATLNGTPVKFRKMIQVALTPQ